MKQVIRNCVFETNSSSEHVLSHTCQVGRVPGWEFFFGKVSPLDKEIQFNYSEFEGIWMVPLTYCVEVSAKHSHLTNQCLIQLKSI